mmetsp:Transcript_84317/g.228901  ORF Transcript_84317/g.228901 Transcript_84317/m.228901 type:complete len:321 (-) Transcript_84317:268-1230(-)
MLIIHFPGDPHALEGAQGCEDGSTNPCRIATLRRGDHFGAHGGWRQGNELALHALGDAREARRAARQDDVAVEVLANVDVASHNRTRGQLVNAASLDAGEARREEHLGDAEALVSDADHLAVRQLVVLLIGRCSHRLLEVQGHVAQLLFDVLDDVPLGRRREAVAALRHDTHREVREGAPAKRYGLDRMGQRVALVNGHCVDGVVANRNHKPGCAPRSVELEDRAALDVERRHIEGFEHDLHHSLHVCAMVVRRRCQHHRMIFRRHVQLVVKCVMQELLQIVKVRDNAMLDGVIERQHAALALSLATNIRIFLAHADHDT